MMVRIRLFVDESFYKEDEADTVWWLDNSGTIGEFVFSFDKQKTYNLFADYLHKLSVEEWLIFNRENAYWVEFFQDRNEEYAKEHAEEITEYMDKAPLQ